MRENDIVILGGDGSGALQTPGVGYLVGSGPSGVTLGDFNADGKLDLVVANSRAGVAVLLNDSN
jgi:hypothetical protein